MTNHDDYNVTMFEACEKLTRSKKSISVYVRKGRLNPLIKKSAKGTAEYFFSEREIAELKEELNSERTFQSPSILRHHKDDDFDNEPPAPLPPITPRGPEYTKTPPNAPELPQEEEKSSGVVTRLLESIKTIFQEKEEILTSGHKEIVEVYKQQNQLLVEQVHVKDQQISDLIRQNTHMTSVLIAANTKIHMLETGTRVVPISREIDDSTPSSQQTIDTEERPKEPSQE